MKVIKLTRGQVTIVDDEDYEILAEYNWWAVKHHTGSKWYAMGSIDKKKVLMHRILLDASVGQQVDHIDGDPLNNQRNNLRLASSQQNAANKRKTRGDSKFKGVTRDYVAKKWRAQIEVKTEGKRKGFTLGRFDTEEEAALAYNEAAIKHFGEFAKLNILNDGYELNRDR